MKKVELFDPYQAYGAVHVGEPSIGSDSPAIYFAFYRGLPEGNYLWSSTDGGDTWQIRNSPRQYNCTYPVLTTDPSVLFVSCVPYWQYTTAGIFRSMDAGISWESLLSTTGIYPLIPSPDFINDHIVFAGLNHSTTIPEQTDLMISLDQGTHWQARDQGLCDAAITAMVLSPDFSEDSTLFVMQNRELIFKSQDAGITWVQLYSDSGASCESSGSGYGHELYVSPDYAQDTTLFSSNSDGLYASYDDGLTWQHLDNHPLNSLFIYRRTDVNTETAPAEPAASQAVPRTDHSVFLPLVALRGPQRLPLTLFATRSNGLPYRSDDGGVTWRPLPLPPWAEQFLPLVMIQ